MRPEDDGRDRPGRGDEPDADGGGEASDRVPQVQRAVVTIGGEASEPEATTTSVKPPQRLVIELTAHWTIAQPCQPHYVS